MVPVKRGKQGADGRRIGAAFARRHDAAFGIVGVALLAPANGKQIGFAAVDHERHRLGRFAERDRQASRGQRIERAGMPRSLGRIQVLDDGDRMRRRHADRLVEHDPAVHVALSAAFVLLAPVRSALRGSAGGGGFLRRSLFVFFAIFAAQVLAAQVALDDRRSQKLLDPFRFVESLVDAKSDLGRKFQVKRRAISPRT